MIFNSFTYLIFLALVTVFYWHLPRRPRHILLFIASCLFYGYWRFDFLLLLLASVLTDYFVGLAIDCATTERQRKLALTASLTVNLGLLAFFKYYYFLSSNAIGLASVLGWSIELPTLQILLPVGISFYVFQTLSYTIDVYRKQIPACRDFLIFANFVIFFPQLVAGPILRATEVMHQLDTRPAFNIDDISKGLERIIGGLFLKVVLADNIAGFVDEGFANDPAALFLLDIFALAFLFGFQIYFDFAAYSHIAIGSARLMGIKFPENFNYPYLAVSPRDFWGRWHISLSSWVRDYLYLPLLGAKFQDRSTGGLAVATQRDATSPRALVALILTWATMGLWHGAAWAFVIWGLWHAMLITSYRLSAPIRKAMPEGLRIVGGWCITLPAVMLAWIPFRTQSVEQTMAMWGKLFDVSNWFSLGLRENYYLVAASVMAGVLLVPILHAAFTRYATTHPTIFRAIHLALVTFSIALILVYLRPMTQFIYFQF